MLPLGRSRVWMLVGMFCFLSVLTEAQVPTQRAGEVGASVMKASLTRTGQPRLDATRGTPVQWDDLLQTDNRGRARIVLLDGSILTLGSDSKLRIKKHDAQSQQTSLELFYGRIRAQVNAITRSLGSFELRTRNAVAGVIGTDFGADDSVPGETKFICISGTTRIYSLDKSSYVDCG